MEQKFLHRLCFPFCVPFAFALGVSLFFRLWTPHFSSPPSFALILLSDLVAVFLFCLLDYGVYLLFCRWPFLARLMRSLLFFLFAVLWAISRRYYALYEAEFAWNHLGRGGLDPNLWASLVSELDRPTEWALGASFVVSLFYFYLLRRLPFEKGLFFGKRGGAGRSKKKSDVPSLERYKPFSKSHIFVLASMTFLLFGYFWFFGKAMHPLYVDEGNVFCRLLYLPHTAEAPPFLEEVARSKKSGLGATENASSKAGKNVSFRFDTRSLVEKTRYAAIPFPGRGRRYNIILYIMESTSHRYMGLQDRKGRSITPYWDKLSSRALLFERHYAQNPLSINALFNILTSAYPLPADRWAAKDYPDIPLASLPSVLKKNGYQTAIYHGGYFAYAGAGRFLHYRGFDEMLDVRKLKNSKFQTLNWGVDDRAYMKPAIQFARHAQAKSKPFFITFLPITPHHPYESPARKAVPGLPRDPRGARGTNFRKYIKALHFADFVMGKTVEAFEREKFGKNTVFFILADHGEAFGQHRRNYNHPFFIYEENVHAPFMIYAPSVIRHPKKIQRISRHIDIFPTILDILGLPFPKTLEGRSLLQAALAQFAPLHTTWRNYLVGLRDGKFKYIYNKRTGKEELYDLASDPLEKKNIQKNHPKLARRFFTKLRNLEEHQRRYFETILQKKVRWDKRQDKEKY